jgi:hypothetical protein
VYQPEHGKNPPVQYLQKNWGSQPTAGHPLRRKLSEQLEKVFAYPSSAAGSRLQRCDATGRDAAAGYAQYGVPSFQALRKQPQGRCGYSEAQFETLRHNESQSPSWVSKIS